MVSMVATTGRAGECPAARFVVKQLALAAHDVGLSRRSRRTDCSERLRNRAEQQTETVTVLPQVALR